MIIKLRTEMPVRVIHERLYSLYLRLAIRRRPAIGLDVSRVVARPDVVTYATLIGRAIVLAGVITAQPPLKIVIAIEVYAHV
jgi:hypothetical protein